MLGTPKATPRFNGTQCRVELTTMIYFSERETKQNEQGKRCMGQVWRTKHKLAGVLSQQSHTAGVQFLQLPAVTVVKCFLTGNPSGHSVPRFPLGLVTQAPSVKACIKIPDSRKKAGVLPKPDCLYSLDPVSYSYQHWECQRFPPPKVQVPRCQPRTNLVSRHFSASQACQVNSFPWYKLLSTRQGQVLFYCAKYLHYFLYSSKEQYITSYQDSHFKNEQHETCTYKNLHEIKY